MNKDGWKVEVSGLTIRDWFAGLALQGILAAQAHPSSNGTIPADENVAAFYALNAFRYADAMLKYGDDSPLTAPLTAPPIPTENRDD